MKTCITCLSMSAVEMFPVRNKKTGLRRNECAECLVARRKIHYLANSDALKLKQKKTYDHERNRAYQLMRHYGLSLESYDRMFTEQDGKCALCRKVETKLASTNKKRVQKLSVDHDHNSGKIRGLLCNPCNNFLGLIGDNVQLLQDAATYIASKWSWPTSVPQQERVSYRQL